MAALDSRRSATAFGVPLKHVTLALLTLQNSALILIMHYSRIMPLVGGRRYFTSTAVFMNEVVKFTVSLTMALYEISMSMSSSAPATALFGQLASRMFTGDSWKLAIPAVLYTLQNSLQYIAISNLNAATFQVTYQLKILATAIFSVTMLRRNLSAQKWLSLVLLMVGVAIVQIPTDADPPVVTMKELREGVTGWRMPRTLEQMRDLGSVAAGQLLTKRSATYEGIDRDYAMNHPQLDASMGLTAVVAACVLSGLAGVYFEKILKDSTSQTTLWTRNVQLSFYSLFPALFIGVVFKDGEEIAKHGFFTGYNWIVWLAILTQAFGGVVVALVINYADNIAKNFATSISIVISFFFSVIFFDFDITLTYLIGTAVVLTATYMYSNEGSRSPAPPIRIVDYEKTTVGENQSYFDVQPLDEKTARPGGALSTSRPNTPAEPDVPYRTYDHEPVQIPKASSSSGHGLPSSPALSASHRQPSQNIPRHVPATRPLTYASGSNSRSQVDWQGPPGTRNPIVQGIELVPTSELPDRSRAIFHFPLFNAIQSKSFNHVYRNNDNFVLSSPTGSGKTAIFELAICRLAHGGTTGSYKVVYMSPTKSLCSERTRDWKKKFSPLNLNVEEMTGDSDASTLRAVQTADIIVTTPEKWDSMTRKWKDHEKLVRLIKLILIDEVHMLTTSRGPTLEAVVSRMKSVGTEIRFVALSATVPNSEDIATWLGRDSASQQVPAAREVFGDEFRPVPLQKYVCGYEAKSNDFAFDSFLTTKLPAVVAKYSTGKPIMVFCFTRGSCKTTAEALARWWSDLRPQQRPWSAPKRVLRSSDKNLQNLLPCGIAVHHAGISPEDRSMVEHAFLNNELSVICCTSTLAVGVNLPCHTVVIKGTVTYEDGGRIPKELSDLDVLQMIGRAGRPQFDTSATAVIMTRSHKVETYNRMTSGQELLESRLHLNLVEHINSEICLGTIVDRDSAKTWLSSTFMFVRLKANPQHYRLNGDTGSNSLNERLEHICDQAIELLINHDLVTDGPRLKATDYAHAMARYYVSFESMKVLMSLPPGAKISEILSSLCQAQEFREIKFRQNERSAYKSINNSPCIRFPIKVDLAMSAHKVSLIIQSTLGDIESSDIKDHKFQYGLDQSIIFQHARRLIRCIVDCQSSLGDSIALRNALSLSRSLGARVWDDSALYMQQLEGIGPVMVRKLINANIRGIEDLEATEPERIERILSKGPPTGLNLLKRVKDFPRLVVSVKSVGEPMIRAEIGVIIKVKAELSFLNDKLPVYFQRQPVYINILAETSDGRKAYFGRISAQKFGHAQSVTFDARLTSANQSVVCYVACDEIAGTLRQASVKPDMDSRIFPSASLDLTKPITKNKTAVPVRPNSSKARVPPIRTARDVHEESKDEFDDDELDDNDLVSVGNIDKGFQDIDDIDLSKQDHVSAPLKRAFAKSTNRTHSSKDIQEDVEPRRLPNGNWECAHRCKDRQKCGHQCCKEGSESKPKRKKPKANDTVQPSSSCPREKTQSKLQLSRAEPQPLTHRPKASTTSSRSNVHQPPLEASASSNRSNKMPQPVSTLNKLHESVRKESSFRPKQLAESDYTYGKGTKPSLSFLDENEKSEPDPEATTIDFDEVDFPMDDLNDDDLAMTDRNAASAELVTSGPQDAELLDDENDEYDAHAEEDDLLEDALIGAEDSYNLSSTSATPVREPLQSQTSNVAKDDRVSNERDQSHEMHVSAPQTMTSAQTADLAEDVTEKVSLFVQDSSSTPARPEFSHSVEVPAKRTLDAVLEPDLEPSEPIGTVSKRAKMDSYDTVATSESRNELGSVESQNTEQEPVVTKSDGVTKASEEEALRQWLLDEFGDSVELV
ncbi:hypothetical protein MBLNU457_g0958t2 [Dothideomycetes sp. NU457]